ELDTEKSFYRLDRANANTLGGSVSTHQITSNSLKTIPAIPILIHGIRLNQLIDAVDGKDIVMTGILDGTLPLSFSDGKPIIEHGKLHARYPG
ncbi:intermembrane phospholipid transport protein YdbH family protein, partial [Vibrio natriegens]